MVDWARRLDDDRRDTVASVGHELKTPLSVVLGLCSRLERREILDGQDAEDLRRIRTNTYILLRRIQDLLLVARLEHGEPDGPGLDLVQTDLAQLLREAVAAFAEIAEQRGQTLHVDAPEAVTAAVDDDKLLSAVTNLLANALRHAPQGGRVRCSLEATDHAARIEVADDGPGVDPELRDRVFDPYQRGPRPAGQPVGTGLGLAIVSEIVRRHGGTVAIDEAPEGGALFVLEIPRGAADGAPGAGVPVLTGGAGERQRAVVEELRSEILERRPPLSASRFRT